MITITPKKCPVDLILKALEKHPIDQSRVTLNQPTGNFFYDKWEIKDEFTGTVWEEILNTLTYDIGEARIIRLVPGESYMAHSDIDNRWHLNLSGEHSYLLDLDNQKMYKQDRIGYWAYMDTSVVHSASNYGSYPRLQLVVRELLKRSKYQDHVTVTIEPAFEQHDYRYKFDTIISPWLNKINKKQAIDDFQHDGIKVKFKLATHLKENFEEIVTKEFKVNYE